MKKLKLVDVASPEIVAFISIGDEKLPDYRCPICGFGVAEEYAFCPYCGTELDWTKLDKKSKKCMDDIKKDRTNRSKRIAIGD